MRLEKAVKDFQDSNPDWTGAIRGLVVINPGNPTGGVLPRHVMEDCLAFCAGDRSDGTHRVGFSSLEDSDSEMSWENSAIVDHRL